MKNKHCVIGSGMDAVIRCLTLVEEFASLAMDGVIVDSAYYRAKKGTTLNKARYFREEARKQGIKHCA